MKRAIVFLVAVALAGCGSGGDGAPSPSSAGPRPSSTATLAIFEPQPGAVVQGPDVTVRLQLDGGRIVEQASTNLTADTGHVHLRLDGRTITLLGGLTEQIEDVAAGRHLLEAEFVAADHNPFNPRVLQTVTFEVR